jgi:NADPH:quinone reductase-like Zn-dependent oxidoreductase
MAGTIEEVGAGVTGFKAGDEVFGMVGGVGGLQGALAEFVLADADLLAHKPKNLSIHQAAALPLGTITAWEGLVDRAQVHAGQRCWCMSVAAGTSSSDTEANTHGCVPSDLGAAAFPCKCDNAKLVTRLC